MPLHNQATGEWADSSSAGWERETEGMSGATSEDALRDLARRAGIAVEWRDYANREHVVASDVLRRLLAALGLPADTRSDLAGSRRLLGRRTSLASLPPMVTATAGRPTRLDVGASESRSALLKLESGGTRDLTLVPARGRLRVPPVLETGYHRMEIGDREIVLAVAPSRCHTLDDAVPDARLWGLAAQVYGLRNPGDGGIGDAAGIAALAEAAAARGADALAISPLHALYSADVERYGPYSPSSRLFLNPLHAAPALVFGTERVAAAIAEAGLGEDFSRLEQAPLIDWPASGRAKLHLLRVLFDRLLSGPDADGPLGVDFATFRADGGPLLQEHAVFEALHAEQMAASPEQPDWRLWPADLRDPGGPTVAAFAAARREDVLFHLYLQWVADRSMASAQASALDAGMRIVLIGDLAVGMDPAGSHAWGRQGDVLGELSIGAPADLFNPRGQDWALTGFSPRALVAAGFAPFIATVRAALRHAGGVRIDHAMGLARLWLIPHGTSPADGAYVAYPMADLFRLLALESVRNEAVVVAEDLGTVPAGFRDALDQAGIHGMRVLWFERNDLGFTPPGDWDRSAIAMTTTHDLPTVAGWWRGSDIAARAACGRLGEGVAENAAAAERAADRPILWQAFARQGVAEGPPPPPEDAGPVVDAALAFVARTGSPLAMLPLEDVLGQVEQPNLPGTIDEHPNWRRRLPCAVGEVFDEPAAAARLGRIAAERPRQ